MVAPQQKNPVEMLEKQIQLLNSILELQQNLPQIHKVNNDFLAEWLNAMLEEQQKQTRYLSNISGATTLWIVLTVLGIIIGFLMWL